MNSVVQTVTSKFGFNVNCDLWQREGLYERFMRLWPKLHGGQTKAKNKEKQNCCFSYNKVKKKQHRTIRCLVQSKNKLSITIGNSIALLTLQ